MHKLCFLAAFWSFVLIDVICAILALHFINSCVLASSSLNAAITLLLCPHRLLLLEERAYFHHLLLKAITVPADCPDSNCLLSFAVERHTKLFLHLCSHHRSLWNIGGLQSLKQEMLFSAVSFEWLLYFFHFSSWPVFNF